MTFGEHLEELRKVVIRSIIAIAFIFTACFALFRNQLMDLVTGPVSRVLPGVKFIVLKPFEEFFAYFKVSLLVSIFLSSPIVFALLWNFVAAGLYKKERKYVTRLLPLIFVLFTVGVLFNYFVLTPGMLKVLANFGGRSDFETQYSIEAWVGFMLWFSLILGALFQLPLVLLLLQKIGVVTPQTLAKNRKFAILGGFILGALITPGDVFYAEVIIGGLVALLYEAGIWIGRLFESPAEPAPSKRPDS